MKLLSPPVLSCTLISSLLFSAPSQARGPKGSENREVRIVFVQGDVRISRGKDHHPDMDQPWEQGLGGELITEGCALATGKGRAEIEFEDGSSVYLAENSLVLFRELAARGDRFISRMTLATGTASFSLQPAADESFLIETPTDVLSIKAPEIFFGRIDAYLDATAITPQEEKGDRLVRRRKPAFPIQKSQTVFIRNGEIVRTSGRSEPDESGSPSQLQSSSDRWESIIKGLPDFQGPPMARVFAQIPQKHDGLSDAPSGHSQAPSEWDTWVANRLEQRKAVTAAALKASGLSSPIPGLADLYEHGTFFGCAPYGTCWEANGTDEALDYLQSAEADEQTAVPTQGNVRFQPQTVQWEEWSAGWCSPPTLTAVTRVARTPEELQKLLRKKAAAQKLRYSPPSFSTSCESGYWIPYRRHYARVVTPVPRKCTGKKCKPVHPPHPFWVRTGDKIGFVPAHPNDVKGKPPLNLKRGIIVPPAKPGEPVYRVDWNAAQRIKVLEKPPREFHTVASPSALAVAAPQIRAHLMRKATEGNSFLAPGQADLPITYDYKSHNFLMASSAAAQAKTGGVPVGGIDGHGRMGSFADGHSTRYAESLVRRDAVALYLGSSSASSREYGSASSGRGGHGSGYSSEPRSSGSHSSSSGSSGSSSSGSTGGGGWASSASSSSSSTSSSSSSSGGTRGRP